MARRVIVFWIVMVLVAGAVPAAWAQDAPPEEPAALDETAPPAGEPEAQLPPAGVPEVIAEPALALPDEEPLADPPEETTNPANVPATGTDTTVPPIPTPTATAFAPLPDTSGAQGEVVTETTGGAAEPGMAYYVSVTVYLCPAADDADYVSMTAEDLYTTCILPPQPIDFVASGGYEGTQRGTSWSFTTTSLTATTITESNSYGYGIPIVACRQTGLPPVLERPASRSLSRLARRLHVDASGSTSGSCPWMLPPRYLRTTSRRRPPRSQQYRPHMTTSRRRPRRSRTTRPSTPSPTRCTVARRAQRPISTPPRTCPIAFRRVPGSDSASPTRTVRLWATRTGQVPSAGRASPAATPPSSTISRSKPTRP